MNFETYKATPGLDRIAPADRFTVWRAAHKRLVREDRTYRERYHQYIASVIIAAGFAGSAWLGSGASSIAASLLLSILSAVAIVYLAFRQQRYMNQRIAGALRR